METQPPVIFFLKEVSGSSGSTEEIYIKRNGESGKEKSLCGAFFKEIFFFRQVSCISRKGISCLFVCLF